MMEIELPDEASQTTFGVHLGTLLSSPLRIHLEGDLGTGKTTLVRGILRGLGHQGPVRSPTYTLIEPYDLPLIRVFHLDLYRLSDPEELEYLGLRDLDGDDVLTLVEWPDRGVGALPAPDLIIALNYLPQGRRLNLSAASQAGARLIESLAINQP